LLTGTYFFYLVIVSLAVTVIARAGPGVLWRLPLVIAAYHFGYGLGAWQGVFAVATGRAPSALSTELTR
jgi:hypothetical protein